MEKKKDVTQTGLKLSIPASASPALGLQACIITPPATHTLWVISGLLIMPEARQTDVILGCSGEMPQGIMGLVQNKRKPFSSNTVILLLFECIHSDCSNSWATDYMAFKDVYPQQVAGRMKLAHCLPSCLWWGQLQGVALKIQISICELSLGVWNPSLPALLPG